MIKLSEVKEALALPFGNTYENWTVLLRSILKTTTSDSISANELNSVSTIPESKIIANLKFFKNLGICTPDSSSSSIVLTNEGKEFAESLVIGNKEKELELLTKFAKIGLKNIIEFYNIRKDSDNFNFDQLYNQIKYISKTKDKPGETRNTAGNYRMGIYTIINILIKTGHIPDSFSPDANKPEISTEKGEIKRMGFEVPTNCTLGWMKKLFTAIETANPSEINKNFITGSVEANQHEGSILKLTRFLEIANKDDTLGNNYEKLRYFSSSDFKQNLKEIIEQKYEKVLKFANLELTTKNQLANVFMKEFSMGMNHAEKAVGILLDLCKLADMKLSDELKTKSTTKSSVNTKGIRNKVSVAPKTEKTESELVNPIPIYQVSDGGFKIVLNINLDASDPSAFDNTVEFIKKIQNVSKNIEIHPSLTSEEEN